MELENKALKLFFIVVVLLSLVAEILIAIYNLGYMYLVLMWIPAISALISIIYKKVESKEKFNFKGFFNSLGFKLCNIKYILIAILLPLIYLLIPYIIYWTMYPNDFAYNGVSISLILSDCLPVLLIGIIGNLISALGEEIGWRGYLVPALKNKYGEKNALIISSLFWCFWHLPLIITGSYLSNIPIIYQIPAFILCIFPVGIICGSLALKTNSVWPSAFLHAAHNNYDQGVFQLITRGDKMFYLVSETGIFTIIIVWIITLMMLLRKRINEKRIRNS